MSKDVDDLKSIKVYKFNNTKEGWHEFALKFRVIDDTVVEFWGLPPLIPLLQCVNRLAFEICSVNSCQSEQGSWLQ